MSTHHASSHHGGSHYLSSHYGRLAEELDVVHPMGRGYAAAYRRLLLEDEMILAVIMAFVQIKDD